MAKPDGDRGNAAEGRGPEGRRLVIGDAMGRWLYDGKNRDSVPLLTTSMAGCWSWPLDDSSRNRIADDDGEDS